MTVGALITLAAILLALVLFATEALSVDLVAMLIMALLVVSGVISPEQGVQGFSNPATITVAFMFVLSAALLKTGALQSVAHQLSAVFRRNYRLGIVLMMLLIALISAFINNTPVVAVFIPVVVQIAYASGQAPSKMLIPLSYASIMGGMCTLIGTSTNILVSGIAEQHGLPAFGMFQLSAVGLPMLAAGMLFMLLIGIRILPDRKTRDDLKEQFGLRDYLTELELMPGTELDGQRIMDSNLVKELEMDIIEVMRQGQRFTLPPGDFSLQAGDLLKVRCDVHKVKALKERVKVVDDNTLRVGDNFLGEKNTSLVELVVTAGSAFSNHTLKSLDFRRTYRAIPLAIRHRNEVLHDHLYSVPLVPGDVILAEVKQHYISTLKQMEVAQDAPFVVLSEDSLSDFNRGQFMLVMGVIGFVLITASLGFLPIMVGTIVGVLALVLARCLSMKEVYDAINWKIVFLLAGALSLGQAMGNTGLDQLLAGGLTGWLGPLGPVAVVSGLYLATSLLTELMSNNATAALLAPIAIVAAEQLGVSPTPLLMAVTIAASASFMTPIGYQTNTMVYSAGGYRFKDFFRTGAGLNLLFWVLASLLIPLVFPF
ncbi:SLC13 family permease [Phaeodactylibacter luteus]|uniref:Sodium-coupled transporter n=1 Tax=Phaeodactylibacter luteus TaxID=1564516 RepID=A0A5C6RI43_9BACT|nr:SLC13 family permease [Phaeodactylibacter luteus]TXB61575.1 sodium-coupled transporter [Phaeodactylibacter luteus]